jgi:hypothetical protein
MSGRPDAREVRHVRHPASHCRVSAEELIGGGDVQASVPRPHPGGSGRPAGLQACPAGHGEVLEVATGGPGLGAGRRAAPGREACLCRRSGRRMSVEGGGSVGIGKRLPSVGAGGPVGGSARRRVVPGGLIGSWRANRSAGLAAVAPASRIQRTDPLSEPELKFLSVYQALLTLFSHLSPATLSSSQPRVSYYLPHMSTPLVLSSPRFQSFYTSASAMQSCRLGAAGG